MGRARNDSGGFSNHAQLRASFTESYRKNIGKQDERKSVKGFKEVMRKNEKKKHEAHVMRDLFVVTLVLMILLTTFYLIYSLLYGELYDLFQMAVKG